MYNVVVTAHIATVCSENLTFCFYVKNWVFDLFCILNILAWILTSESIFLFLYVYTL